ncbi:MAG: redoxin domain-containing protein [Crocinitomicaceae bacterium]
MKKLILLTFLFAASHSLFGQKLKFKVTGFKDTTVHLIKYFGKNLLYADTAQLKNGIVEFDGKKQKPGMLGVLLPGQKFFEFIYNDEDVNLETAGPDFQANMKVKKSVENKIFFEYVAYLSSQRQVANVLTEERKKLTKDTPEFKAKSEAIENVSKDVLAYQNKLIADNPTTLVSKLVKMSMDIVVPPAPLDANGKQIDSLYNYHYYRDHYFDHVDFKDDRLVNTPIFGNRLETYFGKTMMVQHWDSINKYAFRLCDNLVPKSEFFRYCVTNIITTFQKSKIMGMDKVYVLMADRYFCTKNPDGSSPAFWMPEEKLDELCEKIPAQLNTVLGIAPPNISLRDTGDVNFKDFYSLKSEYTILYFWDPDCGHCKKTTPKIGKLYDEKWKARNIEVFGICKAMGEDFQKWKDFIKTNNLNYPNVAVTQTLYDLVTKDARSVVPKYTTYDALNYHLTYDIYANPRIFVLDENKKIIGKQLTVSQLEDMLDRLQNVKDAPKLFPPDPEEDEHMKD